MEADKRALRREILAVRDGLGKDERIRKSSLIRELLDSLVISAENAAK